MNKNDPGIISSIWILEQFKTRKTKSDYNKKEINRIKEYINRKERLGFTGRRYVKVRKAAKRMGII